MAGYMVFIKNEGRGLRLRALFDEEILAPSELKEGEEIIAQIPLSEESLSLVKIIQRLDELEEALGTTKAKPIISRLIWKTIEKAARAAFILGQNIGWENRGSISGEIDRLTKEI